MKNSRMKTKEEKKNIKK